MNFKNLRITEILSIGFVIFLLLFLQQCNRTSELKQDLRLANQNQLALNDSIRIIKNQWGEEIAVKNVLFANQKELKDLNSDLFNDLKKLKGDVLYVQKMVGRIKRDTLYLTNTVTEYPDGTKKLSWEYDTLYDINNGRLLAGYSQFSVDTSNGQITDKGTVITKDEIRLKLTTGITELNDSYQIFVKTDYPGLKFDQLDGAIIDKKKFVGSSNESSWVIGPQFGIGMGYNPSNGTFGPSITVSLGATYNINKQVKRLFKK
jgi:hypothetical protein